jgi:hypothetical protein
VLGRKINVLPLDRSGIRVPVERPVTAQAATQAPRAARPQHGQQQRANGPGQGGYGRRGGRGRGR